MKNIFITATDTDAGKTYVAVGLTHALVKKGYRVAVYKPIAAGCEFIDGQLKNEDALLLQAAGNCQQHYHSVNPITFAKPIAPHIAAELEQQPIDETLILAGALALTGDINIIEGAGGWRLPLGQGRYLSDIVKTLNAQVVLVVNMKLGCLNHAVLTYQSIINDGLECIGWVANCQQTMPYLSQNIAELQRLLPTPCLATLGFEPNIKNSIACFDITLFDV